MTDTTSYDAYGSGAGAGVRPIFGGTAGQMYPVVLKGLFLTVVTLGIYRFWYTTNIRRFLWNNIEVDGDYAEYTGRGVELFIGFLIALAVLIPLYAVIFLVGYAAGPAGAAILNILVSIGILFLAQYALFRARRYRLTRTVWRGIRFQQSGSGWAYAAKSFSWALLVGLTAGLVYPFMRASLERYKMSHTFYGDQQGAFTGTGGQLFKRGILLWVLVIALIALSVVPAALSAGDAMMDGTPDFSPAHLAILLLIVLLPVILVVYSAIEYRWWAENCSIGPASVDCDLGRFAFFKTYLAYLGVVVLFAIAISIVGGIAVFAVKSAGLLDVREPGPAQYALMAVGVVAYFFIVLTFAALWQLFGIRPIWKKSVESLTIVGLPALMAAQSVEPEANAFGEGIADAIDFGGF